MPTHRSTARPRRKAAPSGLRREKGMLTDAPVKAGASKIKPESRDATSLSLPNSASPAISGPPSPTITIIGFDAPSTPSESFSDEGVIRKQQSAAFWAVIEGKANKSPSLRKAASFSAYPPSPSAPTKIALSADLRVAQVSTPASPEITSPSRTVPRAPRLRKTTSCPAHLPQASTSRLPPRAATTSGLALWSHSISRRRPASFKALSSAPSTTMSVATAAFTPCVTTAAPSDTLHQIARASSISSSPHRTTLSSASSQKLASHLTFTVRPTSSSGARRPSSSSLRPPSTRADSHPLRRQLSFDSVSTRPSSDEFELDVDLAFEAETDVSSYLAPEVAGEDETDASDWENDSACAGSYTSVVSLGT